jgi:hypothetical protein
MEKSNLVSFFFEGFVHFVEGHTKSKWAGHVLDSGQPEFLQELMTKHKNTLILFMSDHGNARLDPRFEMPERNLPLFSMIVPIPLLRVHLPSS